MESTSQTYLPWFTSHSEQTSGSSWVCLVKGSSWVGDVLGLACIALHPLAQAVGESGCTSMLCRHTTSVCRGCLTVARLPRAGCLCCPVLQWLQLLSTKAVQLSQGCKLLLLTACTRLSCGSHTLSRGAQRQVASFLSVLKGQSKLSSSSNSPCYGREPGV